MALSLTRLVVAAPGAPVCDSDNGGIKLPSSFCASVVAGGLGTARSMALAANGDAFVALPGRCEAA